MTITHMTMGQTSSLGAAGANAGDPAAGPEARPGAGTRDGTKPGWWTECRQVDQRFAPGLEIDFKESMGLSVTAGLKRSLAMVTLGSCGGIFFLHSSAVTSIVVAATSLTLLLYVLRLGKGGGESWENMSLGCIVVLLMLATQTDEVNVRIHWVDAPPGVDLPEALPQMVRRP
mmetsp:Transcript_73409/g.192492  ORF Transcript_73409/g.192492 Transcript_73409/m.192492 type:complete len:173 (+) Transcript_73409:178-696(+)